LPNLKNKDILFGQISKDKDFLWANFFNINNLKLKIIHLIIKYKRTGYLFQFTLFIMKILNKVINEKKQC
jgi:hypothetical protein